MLPDGEGVTVLRVQKWVSKEIVTVFGVFVMILLDFEWVRSLTGRDCFTYDGLISCCDLIGY